MPALVAACVALLCALDALDPAADCEALAALALVAAAEADTLAAYSLVMSSNMMPET